MNCDRSTPCPPPFLLCTCHVGSHTQEPSSSSSSSFPQQDELEFGYVEAPHKSFPVVFDSPRNRGLKDFAFKKILVRWGIAITFIPKTHP